VNTLLLVATPDRILEVLGIFYLLKGTWMTATGRGFIRAWF
jgi:hypothetical protein